MKKILWLSWKDIKNPQAGGAEVVSRELMRRLIIDGNEVILLTSGWRNCVREEIVNGCRVIRLGNRWVVYLCVWWYYRKNLKDWADIVIDEMNTVPFFARFYTRGINFLFVHQLTRVIWFYEIFFPLTIIGYLLEPAYLWLLRRSKVITVSESTKKDLMKFGFKAENIAIISEGIEWTPLVDLQSATKFEQPTIVSVGAMRAMKQTDHIIKAYLLAKKKIKDLRLIIAGQPVGKFGKKVMKMVGENNIEYLGRISDEEKRELLAKAHLLVSASVKEGWGLVVTEANACGTPAIGYNTDGLRDSIKDNETGLIACKNNPDSLAEGMVKYFSDELLQKRLSEKAWDWSKKINFTDSYRDFKKILEV